MSPAAARRYGRRLWPAGRLRPARRVRPQDPWGPPPGGSGSGWGSGDIIGYGGQGPEPPRRRGSRALVYVVVAALAAGVGAGAVVALNHNSQSPGSTVSSAADPVAERQRAGGANTTNINVQSVANKVQPGMVDINSTLKYQDGAAAGDRHGPVL